MQSSEFIPGDEDLQKMFRLAYYLHPIRLIALYVTLDACDWIPQIVKAQARRPNSPHPHKQKIPEGSIPRFAVYAASQSWELDQESSAPKKKVKYQPTRDDQLIRYIKFLIWKTMDRPACYTAIAIGHFLYAYQLKEIVNLAPDHFNEDNIRRINSYIQEWVGTRFEHSGILAEGDTNRLTRRQPTEHERTMVNKSLEVLAPKFSLASPSSSSSASVLETYFDNQSGASDLERIRAITDPTFVGFERLVNEYNYSLKSDSSKRLANPYQMLSIPKFDDKILVFPRSDATFTGSRASPEPLTETEITAIKHPHNKGA